MSVYLRTDRLTLRQFTRDDVDHLLELDGDPDVRRYLDMATAPSRLEVIERILPRFLSFYEHSCGFGYWAAEETGSGAFVGWFHFRPSATTTDEIELGYRLKPSVWGRGYATEGARALIRTGFEKPGVARVTATALAANAASIRVMEKAGMGLQERFWYKPGMPACKYVLARTDYVR